MNELPPTAERWSQKLFGLFTNHPRWRVILEARIFAALLLLSACVYGFAEIADDVMEKDTHHFDATILRWFRDSADMSRAIGPHWLQTAALDATALGGTTVLIIVVLITLGFLWIAKKRKIMILVAAAAVGGQLFNTGMKYFFSRERPDVVPHLAEVSTASFPSGHSMMSAVIYLTLGALLTRLVSGTKLRVYIIIVAMTLTGLVGLTRVYLGVHYPTDVLAGWTAGLGWALICLLVEQILERRGKVEGPGDETEEFSK